MTAIPWSALKWWIWDELVAYGLWWLALAAIAVGAGPIRRAVARGRFGAAAAPWHPPPAVSWSLILAPLLVWAFALWASQAAAAAYLRATEEDGWLEYLGTAVALGSAVVCGRFAWGLRRQRPRLWAGLYGLAAAVLLWTAGEEVSWGQRLLGLTAPAWMAARNTQQEITLHNLEGVDDALSQAADWGMAVMAFAGVVAWVTGWRRVRRFRCALWLPHPVLLPAFLCVVSYGDLLWLYHRLYPGAEGASEVLWRLQEVKELLLYAIPGAFAWVAARETRAAHGR
jgi:hypothetical protein